MTQNNSFILIHTFNYEVNLQFAISAFDDKGINYQTAYEEKEYHLFVSNKDYLEAQKILKSLDLDDTMVTEESQGYIERYTEWTEHRYDPGYYTGGDIPHWYLDKRIWKYYGPFFLLSGIFFTYFISTTKMENSRPLDLTQLIIPITYLIIGIRLTYDAFKK